MYKFFDKINSPKKHIVGFILADGSVEYNTKTGNYALTVGWLNDIKHIELLNLHLGGNKIPGINLKNKSARIRWYSKYLAQILINLGILVRKSYYKNLKIPKIQKEYMKDFWRGYFDGDEMITIRKKKCEFITRI